MPYLDRSTLRFATRFTCRRWRFELDAEGLPMASHDPDVSAAWSGADGNPVGCMQFILNAAASTGVETVKLQATGTWESIFGIPTHQNVDYVQSAGLSYKLAALAGPVDYHQIAIQVTDLAGNSAHYGDHGGGGLEAYLEWQRALPKVPGDWVLLGPSSVYEVLPGFQPSSTPIALKVFWITNTVGAGVPTADFRLDNVNIAVYSHQE